MERDFWNGRRVLVTGHTGFKGSWLCTWLKLWGAKVSGYSLPPPTRPSLFESARVADGLRSQLADIRDFAALSRCVRDEKPQVLFHLAAQPLVRLSYKEPLETYSVNVLGTANVLEAVRQAGIDCAVVVITTDKCYSNREWIWGYREVDELGGHDPYSSSKACAELVVSAFRTSYFGDGGTRIASARAGNVIGGGDWAEDRLVPDFVRAALAGSPFVIRNPEAVRPWQHVVEPLYGYLLLARKLAQQGAPFAEAWNFGPEDHELHSVGQIADWLAARWKPRVLVERKSAVLPALHETRVLRLDSAKARQRLGWRPSWTIEQALSATLELYQALAEGADARSVMTRQIETYSATAP